MVGVKSERLRGRGGRVAGALTLMTLCPGMARAEDLKVVATIKPIHALVAQVMDGVAVPDLLVQGQASPHTYAMKPSDAKALNAARVVFRVSEQTEPFTKKIVAALPDTVTVVTLVAAPGLSLLEIRSGDTFDEHVHDGKKAADHDHSHDKKKSNAKDAKHDDHDKAAKHDDHDHDAHDAHVWLDPDNAKAMITEIARALSAASPLNAAAFKSNADKAIAGIETLKTQIEADLAPVKGKPFVVFHDAYQYFEKRFGLNAIGSITVSPDVQPSAKRLTQVRAKLKSLGAACVFAEPQFKAGLVNTVIEGTNAKAGVLDPEGALVEAGPNAYADLLRNLASGLKGCLG